MPDDEPDAPADDAAHLRARAGSRVGKRRHQQPRCAVCGVHRFGCLCAVLPRVATRTQIVVVQHKSERKKPTNSARLLVALIENARLITHALPGVILDRAALFEPGEGDAVLHLNHSSCRITEYEAPLGRLYLLDGTWPQTLSMDRRIAPLGDLPRLSLPPGLASMWGLRRTYDPERLSTFEAATRALHHLGEPAAAAALLDSFRRVAELIWWMKRGDHTRE